MADLKTLLNENNQNIKKYIDKPFKIGNKEAEAAEEFASKKIIVNTITTDGRVTTSFPTLSITGPSLSLEGGATGANPTDYETTGIDIKGRNIYLTPWESTQGADDGKTIIKGVIYPEKDTDAANKKYVDDMKVSILGKNISETFDTLKEIQNWIEGAGVNATELTKAIADEAKAREAGDDLKVDKTTYKAYIADKSMSDEEIRAYADGITKIGDDITYVSLDLGDKSYIGLNADNTIYLSAGIGSNKSSLAINPYIINVIGDLEIQEPVNETSATNKKYVDNAIANADISTKLTDYVKKEQLTDYVTDSELTSTLTGYAKKDEITGDIIVSNDWADIENKPTNLATTEQIDNLNNTVSNLSSGIDSISSQLGSTISKTTDILEEINIETGNTIGWNFQNTYINNVNFIGNSESTISYYYDSYPTIAIESDSSSIEMNRGLYIKGDYSLDLSTNNSQVSDSLSITSANSILLNVGNTDDSYIKVNGNIKLPSNYSILDEHGNDRLNKSSSSNINHFTQNQIKFINDNSSGTFAPFIKIDNSANTGGIIRGTSSGNLLTLYCPIIFTEEDTNPNSYYRAHLIKMPEDFISLSDNSYNYFVKIYDFNTKEFLKMIAPNLHSTIDEYKNYLEIDFSTISKENKIYYIEISYVHNELWID